MESTNNLPLVSVLMGTHNPNPLFFKEAIDSILLQTYKNIELIIVNDGSDPEYSDLINEYASENIHVINNKKNAGLTKCLNQGLSFCRGDFIARMDDDDISLPTRIEEQVNALLTNQDVNVLGTDTIVFGDEKRVSHYVLADAREEQQVKLFFGNVGLAHPSVMFRASFLKENGITYNEAYKKAQDYRMWVECTRYSKLSCLPKPLLKYRVHKKQVSSVSNSEQKKCSVMIHREQVSLLGVSTDKYDYTGDDLLLGTEQAKSLKEIQILGKWIKKLDKANSDSHYFGSREFRSELSKRFISHIMSTKCRIGNLVLSFLLFPGILLWILYGKKHSRV